MRPLLKYRSDRQILAEKSLPVYLYNMHEKETKEDQMKLYLRAEPTEESRALLLMHQKEIFSVLISLGVDPRLSSKDDLHRTEIFLGSAKDWTNAFKRVGVSIKITRENLFNFLKGVNINNEPSDGSPIKYDVFNTNHSNFAAVLRLSTNDFTKQTMTKVHKNIFEWTKQNNISEELTKKMLAAPFSPLARDRDLPKAHVTLARGRLTKISFTEVEKVFERIHLVSIQPIEFEQINLRAVGTKEIFNT